MNPLCNATDILPLKLPPLYTNKSNFPFFQSLQFTHFTNPIITLPQLSKPSFNLKPRRCRINATAADRAASAAMSDIDMVQNKEGVYAPKQKKVVVLWDLDNKPPRGQPYEAAMGLKRVAQKFGDVVDISAYANRHAFIHLPQWVLEERRERRRMDIFERKGLSAPLEPYICTVCGRKCRTNLDLKKHFKQLHERERQKKLNRMKQLKGKKRQRYKERFISSNHKYNEAARSLITPKVGYGLASELRRAGVFVKTVEDKPQAADWALKRQMQHSMSRGIDWLFLVSDDSDFSDMLRRARESNLGTVVVGDWQKALGRHADLWIPWIGVENGEVSGKDLVPRSRRRSESFNRDDGYLSVSHFDGGGGGDGGSCERNLDSLMDELVAMRSEINGGKISAFSEGEEEEWVTEELNDDDGDELLWDSEGEETEDEDGYF